MHHHLLLVWFNRPLPGSVQLLKEEDAFKALSKICPEASPLVSKQSETKHKYLTLIKCLTLAVDQLAILFD